MRALKRILPYLNSRALSKARVMEQNLKSQWVSVCNGVVVAQAEDATLKWWEYIATRYNEKQRHYHTLQHIHDMLVDAAAYKHLLKSPKDVALAIFFHDVIYDPKASDNEEQSAIDFKKFAGECLSKGDSCSVDVQGVHDMIMLTTNHQTEANFSEHSFGTDDKHYLLDFDMAILGQDESVYDRYADNIRKEYIFVEEMEYCRRRAEVLKKFLKIPKIYSTKEFYERYEEKARANCEREIARLEAKSS